MNASPKTTCFRRKRQVERTENQRIQKLLTSEYCDFADTVLIESPFAETTRNGRGIRQVALALTPSRLIVAADILRRNPDFFCPPGQDASIEGFELVSVYPLEFLTLSVFGRRRRRTLKARLIDGRAHYYELGGIERRRVFWSIWCSEVNSLLARKMDGSSLSETTAASSSSTSTFYLLSSVEVKNGVDELCNRRTVCRVWAHYGGAGDCVVPTWPNKDVYMGPTYEELKNGRYSPVQMRFAGASLEDVKKELEYKSPDKISEKRQCQSWPTCRTLKNQRRRKHSGDLCDVLFIKDRDGRCCQSNRMFSVHRDSPDYERKRRIFLEDIDLDGANSKRKETFAQRNKPTVTESKKNLTSKISRFGVGVPEKCGSNLVLGPLRRHSRLIQQSSRPEIDAASLIESGIDVWESGSRTTKPDQTQLRRRRLRRYGISTAAHFLHALGPWSVQPGERESVQGRRAMSAVSVRRQPTDSELRLPVSRRQLAASVSCTALQPGSCSGVSVATRGRVVLFWTPEYWYRPRAAAAAYRELRQHLTLLNDYHQEQERQSKKKLFYRRKRNCPDPTKDSYPISESKSSSLLGRIFSGSSSSRKRKKLHVKAENDPNTAQLRRLLRMDLRITIWDLDSNTLAEQLTLIDRDLFTRVPTTEIETLVFQRSSKNAANLGAWVAFCHRVSCLTASEILAFKKLDMRTRIVARFVNAADKCFAMGNFHSCRSILAGLQSPAVYRLKDTWSRLRTHHASRYETMEKLCKIYKNIRTPAYRRAWSRAERNPPHLPYVGDLLTRVLGLDPSDHNKGVQMSRFSKESIASCRNRPLSIASQLTLIGPDTQPSTAAEQNFIKRLLLTILRKVTYSRWREKGVSEIGKDLPWSTGQQRLARKFFDRWRMIALDAKIRATDDRKLMSMDPRRRRVINVATWLTTCQRLAQGYDFPFNSFACEFLLKARYREDRDNFFASLKLEPPRSG